MKFNYLALFIILFCLSSCTVTKEYKVALYNGKPSIFIYDGPVSLLNEDGSPDKSEVKSSALDGILSKTDNDQFWKLMAVDSTTEFVVFLYLHGVKVCGGTWTKGSFRKYDKFLNRVLPQFGNFELRYLHYGEADLDRYKAVADYQKDIDGQINKMFFRGFSYCSSYVTVRRDGQYTGWFGEISPMEDIPEMVKYNMEK